MIIGEVSIVRVGFFWNLLNVLDVGRGGGRYDPGCAIIGTWRECVIIECVYEVVKVVARIF